MYNELYELDPPMRVSLKLYEAWNMDSLTVTAGFFVQLTDFRHYLYWQNRGWGTPVGKYFVMDAERSADRSFPSA